MMFRYFKCLFSLNHLIFSNKHQPSNKNLPLISAAPLGIYIEISGSFCDKHLLSNKRHNSKCRGF